MISSETGALKCPSCGAPIPLKLGETDVRCDYCGCRVTVGTHVPEPTPTATIIIETRRKHVRRHRLRRLVESAGLTPEELER